MEIRAGFEPAINSFADCPLKPLEYRIILVIRAGLEPSITALKGLCPDRLDERTRFAGSCLPASGMRCYKYIVYEHIEECCKND